MQISKISDDYHNQHKEFRKLTFLFGRSARVPKTGGSGSERMTLIHHEGALTYFLFLFLARL